MDEGYSNLRKRSHSDFGVYGQHEIPECKVSFVDTRESCAAQAAIAASTASLNVYLEQSFSGLKKIWKEERDASSTDQDSPSNSTLRLAQVKVSPLSRSASYLHRHASYNGREQELHLTPKDMKHKQVKNVKLKAQRNLSVSTPVMPPSRTLTPDIEGKLTPHRSKSRNKKFHRIFKQVPQDEKVLNYFSCALIADILLQGHLYISENYFGFYSNVFGHVTRILIPVRSVIRITKEKTAKFIPNAVGIVTKDSKRIFGSLLSRETTYRLMYKVWIKCSNSDPGVRDDSELEITLPEIVDGGELDDDDDEEDDDSGSGGELLVAEESGRGGDREGRTSSESAPPSGLDNDSTVERSFPPSPTNASLGTMSSSLAKGSSSPDGSTKDSLLINKSQENLQTCFQRFSGMMPVQKVHGGARSLVLKLTNLPKSTMLLLLSTLLLLFLFMSAAVLIYRLNALQQKMGSLDVWNSETDFKVQIFQEVFKWQRQFHDNCINHVQESLDTHIHQLFQVRRSLQALLLLLLPDLPKAEGNKNSEKS